MDIFEISKILSKDDVIHLTKKLNEEFNNIQKISNETGLMRDTIYSYLNEKISDIKEENKSRILGACLTYNREYTLNFLLNRFKSMLSSIAYSNIDFLSEKIINTTKFENFHELYTKFVSVLQENKHYLIQNYREEIFSLLNYFDKHHGSYLKFYISPKKILEDAEKEESTIKHLLNKVNTNEFIIRKLISNNIQTSENIQESETSFRPIFNLTKQNFALQYAFYENRSVVTNIDANSVI